MRKELPKVYDPRDVEPRIYKMWMDGGCFKAEPNPDKKPFSIVMPPPNVTGQLHMGHALDSTLQDILTRFKRMQGYEALWLPGTDHAGIATQIKVEEALRKVDGVQEVKVNFLSQKLTLAAADDAFDAVLKQVVKTARKVEPDCEIIL